MEKFEISILGCGCAVPTMRHNPAAQIVNFRHKLFMIDCGEGTQLQYRRRRLPFARLQAVFISHLHGDFNVRPIRQNRPLARLCSGRV